LSMSRSCTQWDMSFRDYLKKTIKTPRLTAEEECELGQRYRRDGDQSAAHKLIVANLYVVVGYVSEMRYRLRDGEYEELISAGNEGLMRALSKWEPGRGLKFCTYATYWVRCYIRQYLFDNRLMVGNSGSGVYRTIIYHRFREALRIAESIYLDYDDRVSYIAERMNVKRVRVESWMDQLESYDISLDAPNCFVREDSFSFSAIPEELVGIIEQEERNRCTAYKLLAGLDPRERLVIQQNHMDEQRKSLATIARELGISRERTRQLEQRALGKMKKVAQELETPDFT